MAKIRELPGLKIIRGFRGKLDFYYWKGIACVRSWPRKPSMPRTPAVRESWGAWRYISKAWNELPVDMRAWYEAQAVSTNMTGRDLFSKNYLSSGSVVRL